MRLWNPAIALILALCAFAPATANCTIDVPLFFSYSDAGYSYVFGAGTDAGNLVGYFWEIGRGDPVVDAGIDNGNWRALRPGNEGWLRNAYAAYAWPFYVEANWGAPPSGDTIDGCIGPDNPADPPCMAMLLTDYAEGCNDRGWTCTTFAYLSAAREGLFFFFDQPGNGRIDMVPTPRMTYYSMLDDFDTADSFVTLQPPIVDTGLYLDPVCTTPAVVGYKVYRTFEQVIDQTPEFFSLTAEHWQVMRGGQGEDGSPIPMDDPATVYPGCPVPCAYGTCPYFAYTLVFDSGFETPYVTILENTYGYGGDRFQCCQDADVDGFCAFYLYDPDLVDCDDYDAAVYPGAPQVCDGANNDCLDPAWPEPPSEIDGDGDGFLGCEGDCADWNPRVYPGAPELCDGFAYDCSDPDWPRPLDATDRDGDGYSECTGDCDDVYAGVYPEAPEVCDGIRNDCTLSIEAWRAIDYDNDRDGFSVCAGDCDDADRDVYPGAPEVCDGVANDCTAPDWPTPPDDVDDDGDGFAECAGDCDDVDPTTYPGAPQLCDGVANDCNANDWPMPPTVDDLDGDTYAECRNDCNDADPAIRPTERETCNGADDDCDGKSDEAVTFEQDVPGTPECGRHFGLRIARVEASEDARAGARFAVTARGLEADFGSVEMFYGPSAQYRRVVFHPAPQGGDRFGSSVAAIGDVNADGWVDLLVGAESDSTTIPEVGSAHVFSGVPPYPHLEMVVDPDGVTGDRFGYNVAGLGDVDGDGVEDFLVGARGDDDSRGSTTVFSGADRSIETKLTDPAGAAGDLFGYISAGLPDVTDDGVADIAVAAYAADSPVSAGAGKVLIFSGADFTVARTLNDPDGKTGDAFGRGLAVAGDVNGDGVADLAIGSPGRNDGRGEAALYDGATGYLIGRIVDADGAAGDQFGYHVAGVDDLDGDGVPELLIGAFAADTPAGANAGSASIVSGATRQLIEKLFSPAGEAGGVFGFSGTGVGDLDDDGTGDIVIGSYLANRDGFDDQGAISVFSAGRVDDIDADGVGDACDVDRDGDGIDNDADCAPDDGRVWQFPGNVGATLSFSSDTDTLWWSRVDQATRYHVYRAQVAPDGSFAFGPNPWRSSSRPNVDITIDSDTIPSYFYLVTASSACGESDRLE